MNPKKWVTAGKVRVVPAGYAFLRDKAEGRSLVVARPWPVEVALPVVPGHIANLGWCSGVGRHS